DDAAACAANGPPAGAAGRCVRYQASAARATSATTATIVPSQRRRGGDARAAAPRGARGTSKRHAQEQPLSLVDGGRRATKAMLTAVFGGNYSLPSGRGLHAALTSRLRKTQGASMTDSLAG